MESARVHTHTSDVTNLYHTAMMNLWAANCSLTSPLSGNSYTVFTPHGLIISWFLGKTSFFFSLAQTVPGSIWHRADRLIQAGFCGKDRVCAKQEWVETTVNHLKTFGMLEKTTPAECFHMLDHFKAAPRGWEEGLRLTSSEAAFTALEFSDNVMNITSGGVESLLVTTSQ